MELIPTDCVSIILRLAGVLEMRTCSGVCKLWRSIIFTTKLPAVMPSRYIKATTEMTSRWFNIYVRNRRGYTKCSAIVYQTPDTATCILFRGKSVGVNVMLRPATAWTLQATIYGGYHIWNTSLSRAKALWPDQEHLETILDVLR